MRKDRMSIELELSRATNMFGPLSPDIKNRLRAYYAEPSQEKWRGVSCIIVGGHMTVWQAWVATERSAPTVGLDVWPNRLEFHRALAHATRKESHAEKL